MGTMAMFWDGDPVRGGRAIGWLGMDGHPNSLETLAHATSRKSLLIRLKAIKRRRGRHWIDPRPGCWAYWAGSGYCVMDFGYWFDEARGRTMVISHRSAPMELTPEIAVDPQLWPKWHLVHEPHVHVPLPELHVTADPDDGLLLHRWSAADESVGEVDAARLLLGQADVEISRIGRTMGMWAPDGWAGMFEVSDANGKPLGSGRRLASACGESSRRVWGDLGPVNPDARNHYKLYSVEALFEEFPIGDASVSRDGRVFTARVQHALAGEVVAESQQLHEALLTVRRRLHSVPGFRLDAVKLVEELRARDQAT